MMKIIILKVVYSKGYIKYPKKEFGFSSILSLRVFLIRRMSHSLSITITDHHHHQDHRILDPQNYGVGRHEDHIGRIT